MATIIAMLASTLQTIRVVLALIAFALYFIGLSLLDLPRNLYPDAPVRSCHGSILASTNIEYDRNPKVASILRKLVGIFYCFHFFAISMDVYR
jgi:hypothetical protein